MENDPIFFLVLCLHSLRKWNTQKFNKCWKIIHKHVKQTFLPLFYDQHIFCSDDDRKNKCRKLENKKKSKCMTYDVRFFVLVLAQP